MTEGAKRQVIFLLDTDELERVEGLRWSLRMTRSELIRTALREYLDRVEEGRAAGVPNARS